MCGLEIVEVGFMHPNGFLELLDVLGTTLTKGSLCLPVSLLTLLGSSVDLISGNQPC